MKNTDHPENPYKLRTCVWEITLACCFSCRYCGSSAGRARQNELTTEECLNVADQLAELGCRRTALIGGEVFIVSRISRNAKYLKRTAAKKWRKQKYGDESFADKGSTYKKDYDIPWTLL